MTITPNDLSPYLAPDARDQRLESLARNAGAELRSLGTSHEQRTIWAVRVPCLGSGSAPARVLLTANLHGPEFIGCMVALGFLEQLGQPSLELRALRERAEVWVVPVINPDGYARTWEAAGIGTLKTLRSNAAGVDLNRNFPRPGKPHRSWLSLGGWASGSDDPQNPFFSGTGPSSEPETQAVARLLDEVHFHASLSLHSLAGIVLLPCLANPTDRSTYRGLARAYTRAQTQSHYRCVNWGWLDRVIGELEDFQHHTHGTWATCVELFPLWASYSRHPRAPSLFWRFNPHEPEPWVRNELPAITAYFLAALAAQAPRGDGLA